MDSNIQKVRRRRTTIEGTAFNFSNFANFESLALSTHHYADVLNSFVQKSMTSADEKEVASSDGRQNIASYQTEVLDLRRRVFQYSTDNTEAVRAALVHWDAELGGLDLLQRELNSEFNRTGSTGGAEDFVAIGNRRSRTRSQLVEEFLMMLKISAEAGNDLFGVSSTYEDKVTVANSVFKILSVSIFCRRDSFWFYISLTILFFF